MSTILNHHVCFNWPIAQMNISHVLFFTEKKPQKTKSPKTNLYDIIGLNRITFVAYVYLKHHVISYEIPFIAVG